LQLFRRSLLNWLPYLKRRLRATDVYIETRPTEFDVVVVWKKDGVSRAREFTFNKAKILGDNARTLGQMRLVQPVCRFVDDIVAFMERP
jgi:hypothetical protein